MVYDLETGVQTQGPGNLPGVNGDAGMMGITNGLSWGETLAFDAFKEVGLDPNKPPKSKNVILEALEYARPEPVSGDWIGVHREITSALEGVYGGSKRDPKEALDEIAGRVNELIVREPTAE